MRLEEVTVGAIPRDCPPNPGSGGALASAGSVRLGSLLSKLDSELPEGLPYTVLVLLVGDRAVAGCQ